jgi:hypothetical protein
LTQFDEKTLGSGAAAPNEKADQTSRRGPIHHGRRLLVHAVVINVARHTDDSPPGIYGLSNRGVVSAGPPREYPRDQMVPAFGDVGFKLQVGEIGVADYDARTSPYGYHVIKRVE